MKRYLVIGLVLAFAFTGLHAQDTSSSSASTSSGAQANGHQANSQQLVVNEAPIPAAQSVKYSGMDRGAPTVVTGGFAAGFSSDNCGNTAQGGVSGPGVGVNFGMAHIDSNCAILRRVDAHIRTASGYAAMQLPQTARYQLDQAAIDLCIADGYDPASCQKNAVSPAAPAPRSPASTVVVSNSQ